MLQRTITSREFAEWQAFYNLEPFGVMRSDLQAGVISSTIANVNRDPKKRAKPYQPSDFILQFEPKQSQTPETLKAKVELINLMFGGKDLRTDGNAG